MIQSDAARNHNYGKPVQRVNGGGQYALLTKLNGHRSAGYRSLVERRPPQEHFRRSGLMPALGADARLMVERYTPMP